jgi:hypothetical protein
LDHQHAEEEETHHAEGEDVAQAKAVDGRVHIGGLSDEDAIGL